jgi:NAD(P)-dependent dehydrogenase (short-subunit alcohol dehydrogenase family)
MTPHARDRKSILITGAASGMGRETARLFASRDWFVGAVDKQLESLQTLRAELGAENCLAHTLDVTSYSDYVAMLQKFSAATDGKLDLLFNNAGISRGGPFDRLPFEDVMAVVNVNLVGVLIGIHAAAALLKATPNSLCLSIASAVAIFGLPNMAIYAATKHAVKGLTESLSLEFRAHNVRVADIMPGLVDTPFIPRWVVDRKDQTGMFRVVPSSAVANTVWAAYHSDKLHWYVPEDLAELALAAARSPETVREQVASQTGPFTWMKARP